MRNKPTEYFPGGAFIRRVFMTSKGWVMQVATPAAPIEAEKWVIGLSWKSPVDKSIVLKVS